MSMGGPTVDSVMVSLPLESSSFAPPCSHSIVPPGNSVFGAVYVTVACTTRLVLYPKAPETRFSTVLSTRLSSPLMIRLHQAAAPLGAGIVPVIGMLVQVGAETLTATDGNERTPMGVELHDALGLRGRREALEPRLDVVLDTLQPPGSRNSHLPPGSQLPGHEAQRLLLRELQQAEVREELRPEEEHDEERRDDGELGQCRTRVLLAAPSSREMSGSRAMTLPSVDQRGWVPVNSGWSAEF